MTVLDGLENWEEDSKVAAAPEAFKSNQEKWVWVGVS
jgi:hypothetical protein